jgi:uncharacterized protein (DUF2267 family)
MTADDFIAHVAGHAGVPIGEARTAACAVLSAIGGSLGDARRQFVADELPLELRAAVLDASTRAVPLEERLLAPGERVARARELIASVCRVLAEELSSEALAMLRAALPAELSRLLERPPPAADAEQLVPGMRDTDRWISAT